LRRLPCAVALGGVERACGCAEPVYPIDGEEVQAQITALLRRLDDAGVVFKNLHTHQSSLEDIFVDLVRGRR